MAYERKLDSYLITDRVLIKNFPTYDDIVEGTIRKYDHKKITKKINNGEKVYGSVVGFKAHTGRVMVHLEDSKHGTYIGFRKKDISLDNRSVGAMNFNQIGEMGKEAYDIVYGTED